MLKEAGELAMNLIPPHDGDPEKIYRWRVILAGTVAFMAASIGTHIALACGFIPALFPGFASASDVDAIKAQQTVMRMESLGDAIYALQKDRCIAQSTGNLSAAQTQDQRIRDKSNMYWALSKTMGEGKVYDLPPCELFVSR